MLASSMKKTNSFLVAPKGFLESMEIFKNLPPEALREIEKSAVEKKYARQSTIVLEGEPAESVWFVKEGHVKAVNHAASGRCQTLCMVGAKGMFGSCCALGGGRYSCHVVAETDVTVVSLPMGEFNVFLSKYPQIGKALVAHLSLRLQQSKSIQAFDRETVEKRILHALKQLVGEFGTTIPLTRKEIAEMAGTTVETSIRTFSRLEKEGLVSTARGRIVVKNIHELEERLEAL